MHVYDPSVFLHVPIPHGDLAHVSITVKNKEQIHILHLLKPPQNIMYDELSTTYLDIKHPEIHCNDIFIISQDNSD